MPVFVSKVLGQHYDLAHVIGIVRHLPVDRLHHRVGLAANGDGMPEVVFRERLKRAELPTDETELAAAQNGGAALSHSSVPGASASGR